MVELSGAPAAPVLHFRIEASEHPIEFESLGNMLRTVGEGFSRGVFFADTSGHLEMDDLAFAALASELNPAIRWWTG